MLRLQRRIQNRSLALGPRGHVLSRRAPKRRRRINLHVLRPEIRGLDPKKHPRGPRLPEKTGLSEA